jgi:hypothetical protein
MRFSHTYQTMMQYLHSRWSVLTHRPYALTQPLVTMYTATCNHVRSHVYALTQPLVTIYAATCNHVRSHLQPCTQPLVTIYAATCNHVRSHLQPCTQPLVTMYAATCNHVRSHLQPYTQPLVCTYIWLRNIGPSTCQCLAFLLNMLHFVAKIFSNHHVINTLYLRNIFPSSSFNPQTPVLMNALPWCFRQRLRR